MKLDNKNEHFTLTTHSKCVSYENEQENGALALLHQTGISLIDAARLVLELYEACGNRKEIPLLKKVISLGAEQLKRENHTVSFAHAVEFTIESKQHRSPRTLQDIRQTLHRLMQQDPELADKPIRSMDSSYCRQLLHQAYQHSPSRFIKARANLSGLFSLSIKQEWCSSNPVAKIDIPHVKERVIEALPLTKIRQLFKIAHLHEHKDCLAPLALMIYAGVRPEEIKRLSWEDLDWDEQVLYIDARHAKTGGGRHVPLMPALINILSRVKSHGPICPTAWDKRWQTLRQEAGFDSWVPDVLRHSYASYHAKMYQDLPLLQLAMGHRDCQLLLTRYINLRGIKKKDAQQFWKGVI